MSMFINWLIQSSVRTNEPTSLAWWEDSDTIMSILIHSVVTRWVEMIIYLVSCVSFYRFNSETEINFTWTPSPHVQLGGFTIRGSTDLAPLDKCTVIPFGMGLRTSEGRRSTWMVSSQRSWLFTAQRPIQRVQAGFIFWVPRVESS